MGYDAICPASGTFFSPASAGDTSRNLKFAELYHALIAEPYDKVEVEDKFKSWTVEQTEYLVPCLIVAGLTLLLWFPLWISRCCAHRCCAPTEGWPSERTRKIWTGTFCATYLVTFACAIVGVVACFDVWRSVRSATCVSLDSLIWVEGEADESYAVTRAAGLTSTRAVVSMNNLVGNASCARDTLTALCPMLSGALESAEEIRNITGDDASDEFKAVYEDVQTASTLCELSSASLYVGYLAFAEILSELEGVASDLREPLRHALKFFTEASKTARDAVKDIADAYDVYDPIVETVCIIAASVLFFSPILVNTIAAAVIGCVLWKPEVVENKRKQQWGVQIVGCSWVLSTIICFFYFLAAALLLIGGEGARQGGAVFKWSASNFNDVYNNTIVCGGPMASYVPNPPDFNDLGQMCNLTAVTVSECWEGGNFFEALLVTLGSETTLKESIDKFLLAREVLEAFNFEPIEEHLNGLSAALTSAWEASTAIDAADFFNGEPTADDLAAVESLKADMDANLTDAASLTNDTSGCYGSFLSVFSGTVSVAILLIDAGLQALRAIHNIGECTEFYAIWMGVVYSVYDVAHGPLVCACVGLIVTGALVFLYAPGSIAMQIIYGGVGHEPGCPVMCRCCCPMAKHSSVKQSSTLSKARSVSDQTVISQQEAGEVQADKKGSSTSWTSKMNPKKLVGRM